MKSPQPWSAQSPFQMLPPLLLPLLLLSLSLPSPAASDCVLRCGSNLVPYPFGFSDDCPIRLNCTDSNRVQLGGFDVRSFSAAGAGAILVEVPPSCDRRISDLHSLFGANYAVSSRNALLLRNCSSSSSGCAIPGDVVRERAGALSCGSKVDNVTCFYNGSAAGTGFLTRGSWRGSGSGCLLYSSMAYHNSSEGESGSGQQVLSFEFQTLEVGWWVAGNCSHWCSTPTCRNVTSPVDGSAGVTCGCGEGLTGDGFRKGVGCRKTVSSGCNPSKYVSGNCGRSSRVGVLVGGIVAGAVLMATVGLVFFCIRRRAKLRRSRKSTKRLLSEASCSVPLYPYKEIERATDNFSDSNRLGTGAYGTVYYGTLHGGEQVAIKKLRHNDPGDIEQVLNEIKLLSSTSHPNLVRILGCCFEQDEQILVYEYMPNGTLSHHLHREKRDRGLPWTVRLNIAAETARAISHLHFAVHPPIYHRDIKSSNILLDHNFNSKLADFGLSKMIVTESSHVSTAPQGTPGYLDPQYHQNFHLSDKSDVYSFGVVLVEIITALKVVDFSRGQSDVNLAALAVNKIGRGCVEEIIDPFLEPHRDAWTLSSIHKVAELAFRCLAFHRDMRPSMAEVADELEQIRASGWAPPDENMLIISRQSSVSSFSSPFSNGKMHMLLKTSQLDDRFMAEDKKVDSPVSAEDPWFSEHNSPSANILLGHRDNFR